MSHIGLIALMLRETPLTAWHRDNGARMTDFHGWRMPLQYTSITEEHQTVRTAAGLFDLGHMGRIRIDGSDRLAYVQKMTTADVAGTQEGTVQYGFLCNEKGGIIDDITIYRAEEYVLLVVNGANRSKVMEWLASHPPEGDVRVRDVTDTLGMIAVQGPQAQTILQTRTDFGLGEIRYYHFEIARVAEVKMLVSRTGYTGEDGFELYMGSAFCLPVWDALLEQGHEHGLAPVGLGARDTLRLEAGMPLYGNELDETISPFEAGLGKFVQFDKPDFVGRPALLERSKAHMPRRLCCLVMRERCIPRRGYEVSVGGMPVGEVTSGTFSPTLAKGIAMAYLDVVCSVEGMHVEVAIRGKKYPARVVRRPFYKRNRQEP